MPTPHPAGERAPLPTSLSELPAPDPSLELATRTELASLGAEVGASAMAALLAHARLLGAWNEAINLTAIRDPADVARLHIADSLSALALLGPRTGARTSLLDIGSGGGYPGLALAAALRPGRVGLVDSVAKKARFLSAAADLVSRVLRDLGETPPTIAVHARRAEDLARNRDEREAWDIVTARAVGSLAEVAELALPLTRVGGLVVAWKRLSADGGLARELDEARGLIRAAGGLAPRVVEVGGMLRGHRLVVVYKRHATPERFPRPVAGRRASRPPVA